MSLRWVIAVCLLLPHALAGQTQPELLRTHGNLDREVLVNVKAAQMAPEGLAVLTEPNPAIHLFTDGQPQWRVLADGIVAFWTPESGNIRLIDLQGQERSRVPPVAIGASLNGRPISSDRIEQRGAHVKLPMGTAAEPDETFVVRILPGGIEWPARDRHSRSREPES